MAKKKDRIRQLEAELNSTTRLTDENLVEALKILQAEAKLPAAAGPQPGEVLVIPEGATPPAGYRRAYFHELPPEVIAKMTYEERKAYAMEDQKDWAGVTQAVKDQINPQNAPGFKPRNLDIKRQLEEAQARKKHEAAVAAEAVMIEARRNVAARQATQ